MGGLAMKRVIYLSSGQLGRDMLDWLRTQPCEIVLATVQNKKINFEFHPYDLGISFLYTHKIPASEFLTPYKWVNFHPGPLPEFRGRNLAYHAIMQEADCFGATLHYMDEEFDTGDLIEVSRFPIRPEDTAGDLVRLSHMHLVMLFKSYIPQLLRYGASGYPQSEHPFAGKARYYPKAPIDDHIELAEEERRRVRAVTVYPKFCATTIIGGKKYKIVPDTGRTCGECKHILARTVWEWPHYCMKKTFLDFAIITPKTPACEDDFEPKDEK